MSYKEPCDSNAEPNEEFVVIPSSDPRLGATQVFHIVSAPAGTTPEEALSLVRGLEVPGQYLVFKKSAGKNLKVENSITVKPTC